MTAHEWINQHKVEYRVKIQHINDIDCIYFYADKDNSWVDLSRKSGHGVCMNLKTAEDCINLCKLLRVTPKKKKKKKNGSI